MSQCLFCSIIEKKIKAEIIYEDNDVLVFRDISPQAPHHVLIIPKKHIANLLKLEDTDAQLLASIAHAIKEVAKSCGVETDGFRIVINNGPNAGQAVDHLHFHLLGGRKLNWPPG
ncbi:MAG: histidine triad nucleotide-binding protein [bacterium]